MNITTFCDNILPSGSGFNSNWEYIKEQKNGSQVFETYFSNMNENGCYEGYTKIRLTIPQKINDFRITLVGPTRYTDWNTRDYLIETIYDALRGLAFNWDRDDMGVIEL